ncbi:MAG: hypothetical protein V1495_03130 [Pseudomonadota bacterium]
MMNLRFFKKTTAVLVVAAVAVAPVPFSKSNRAEAQWQIVLSPLTWEAAVGAAGAALFVGTLAAGAIANRKPLAMVWNEAVEASSEFDEKWMKEVDRIFKDQFDSLSIRVARANQLTAEGFYVAPRSSTYVAPKAPQSDLLETSATIIGLEILMADFLATHALSNLSMEQLTRTIRKDAGLRQELTVLLNAYGALVLQASGLGGDILERVLESGETIRRCLSNPQMWKILAAGVGNLMLPASAVAAGLQALVHQRSRKESGRDPAAVDYLDPFAVFFLYLAVVSRVFLFSSKPDWSKIGIPGLFDEGAELFSLISECSERIDLT